jgi:hypothetical protein
MSRRLSLLVLTLVGLLGGAGARAEWQVLPPTGERQPLPQPLPPPAQTLKPGDRWPDDDKYRWLVSDVVVPEKLGNEITAGKIVGLKFSCGDGGEVWVNGELQARFDNDHPALVVLTTNATPGASVRVAALVYAKVQGGDRFGEAELVLIEPRRASERLVLTVNPKRPLGKIPDGIIGLSQGGGMSDYEDATAARLRAGGFKWFRMDNVLTGALKQDANGKLTYDWAEFDRRLDFLRRVGAEPIFAASYMPQPLDAIVDHERHSAPKDYAAWEELCFQAARHAKERGTPVSSWEVWNEVNAGWLKPGPQDTGGEPFKSLYAQALGKPGDEGAVRRFEAYCKLYAATARGVRRAAPTAKIGGPALASGPFENSENGACQHGRGFAKGLVLWCEREKLPLDFLSWHEYFQPADFIAKEAETLRSFVTDIPRLRPAGDALCISEWNQAWWADRPHDHEIAAAWCANGLTRAIIPQRVAHPCFFYVKQGDPNFRGDYALLMPGNLPKATFNMAKLFNGLSGEWIEIAGGDDDVSAVACWDAKRSRLAIVLVNFRERHAVQRAVRLELSALPKPLAGGEWRMSVVDATHANAWHNRAKAELTVTESGGLQKAGRSFALDRMLTPNSITLVELLPPALPGVAGGDKGV